MEKSTDMENKYGHLVCIWGIHMKVFGEMIYFMVKGSINTSKVIFIWVNLEMVKYLVKVH